MYREVVVIGQVADGGQVLFAEDRTAAEVVRVLEADETGPREMVVGRAHRCSHLARVEPAIGVVPDRFHDQAAESRCAAYLEVKRVRQVADYDFVAPPTVSKQSSQVALRTTRNK